MARSRRQWGSVRQVRKGGRWQARYLDPDSYQLVPASSTFATKADADRWLANKRSEVDRGVLVDEREGSRPLSHWWPGYVRSLGALRASTVRTTVLSPTEVEQLAKAMKNPVDGTLVHALAYGGLRIGEAHALRCKDLDLSADTLRAQSGVRDVAGRMQVGATMTYAARTVTLPRSLVRELAAHLVDAEEDALTFGPERRSPALRQLPS